MPKEALTRLTVISALLNLFDMNI